MPSANQNSLTVIQPLLYKVILPTVRKEYRVSTPLLMEFDKNKDGVRYNMENNQFNVDIVASPIYGGFTGAANKMIAGLENLAQFNISAVPMYISVQYPDFVKASTNNDKGAVERLVARLTDDMTMGIKLTLNRSLWGTGNGVLAFAEAGSGAGTATVALDPDRPGAGYITPGMTIQISGATGGTSISGNVAATTVNSVNYSTNVLTLADSLSFTSGAGVSMVGPDGNTVTETQGIQSLVATSAGVAPTTVQGVTLSTLPNQQPHVFSTAGSFSTQQVITLQNACKVASPDLWFCNNTVYNKMINSVIGQERTGMGNQAYLDIGYKTFSAMGGTVDVVLDRDCPYGSIYGINKKGFYLGILEDISFLDLGGLLRIPGYPVYELAMKWYGNIANASFEPNFAYVNIQ